MHLFFFAVVDAYSGAISTSGIQFIKKDDQTLQGYYFRVGFDIILQLMFRTKTNKQDRNNVGHGYLKCQHTLTVGDYTLVGAAVEKNRTESSKAAHNDPHTHQDLPAQFRVFCRNFFISAKLSMNVLKDVVFSFCLSATYCTLVNDWNRHFQVYPSIVFFVVFF